MKLLFCTTIVVLLLEITESNKILFGDSYFYLSVVKKKY